MAQAAVAAKRFLYSALSGNATLTALVGLKFYSAPTPPGTTYPIVLSTNAGAADNTNTLEARRIWSEFIYAVRYINKVESFIPLEAGAAAIENALSRASGTNVSGDIVMCVYQAPYESIEIDRDGFTLMGLGGLYRLYVQ